MAKLVYVSRGLKNYRCAFLSWVNRLLKANELIVLLEKKQSHDNDLIKRLENQGIKFIYFNNSILTDNEGFNSRWFNIYFSLDLLLKLRNIKPQIIFQEGVGGHGLVNGFIKLLSRKCKLIVSYERNSHTERNEHFIKKIYKKIYFKFLVSKTFVPTKSSYKYLRDKIGVTQVFVKELNAYFHKSSYKAKSFEEKLLKIKTDKKIKFVFIGQFIKRKGVSQLISFLLSLKGKSDYDFEIKIIGGGPLKYKFNKLKNSQINYEVIGQVNFKKVSQILVNSDILILPTLEDNYSLVIQEAINCNVLPFTSRENGAFNQLIEPYFKEFYFDIKSINLTVLNFLKMFKTLDKKHNNLELFFSENKKHSAYKAAKFFVANVCKP